MGEIQEAYGSVMLHSQSPFGSESAFHVDYTVTDLQPLLAHGLGVIPRLQSAKANVLVLVRRCVRRISGGLYH